MSTIPSEADCISLLEEAGCKRRVIVHCCTVRVLAEEIAKKIDCDTNLVIAGALLHDIGRSVDHSINHAVIGSQIAMRLGLPKVIVEIIRKHVGAGLDDDDVYEFGLPQGDYIPGTIEEKIVAHADNMVSDNHLVPHSYTVEKLKTKGSYSGAVRVVALHKELSDMYGSDLDELVDKIGPYPEMKGVCKEFTVPEGSRF